MLRISLGSFQEVEELVEELDDSKKESIQEGFFDSDDSSNASDIWYFYILVKELFIICC